MHSVLAIKTIKSDKFDFCWLAQLFRSSCDWSCEQSEIHVMRSEWDCACTISHVREKECVAKKCEELLRENCYIISILVPLSRWTFMVLLWCLLAERSLGHRVPFSGQLQYNKRCHRRSIIFVWWFPQVRKASPRALSEHREVTQIFLP
jgi:hypothetical protein